MKKQNKKVNFKFLFAFILGGIIFGSVVYAVSYNAGDISYTKTDGSVTNVGGALDELYEKNGSSNIIYLGTGISFDVSDVKGYEKFTEDNFIVGIDSLEDMKGQHQTDFHQYISAKLTGFTIEKNYDQATGVLTVSGVNYKMTVCNDDSYKFCSDISVNKNAIPFVYLVNGPIN